jgi:hypothetical protein
VQGFERGRQAAGRFAHRKHPIALGDQALEALAHHECQKTAGKLALAGRLDHRRGLDMQVMPFREGRGLVVVFLLDRDVIGRRRDIGQHHVSLPFQKQAISLRPAFGESDDARLQLRPGLACLVAVNFAHPEQETETGCRGSRVLQHDARPRRVVDKLGKAFGWSGQFGAVIDESQMAVIERQERIVQPCQRQGQPLKRMIMRSKEIKRLGFGDEIHVDAEHDIGLGGGSFKPQASEKRAGIVGGDESQFAPACFFEGGFHSLARPIFPGEGGIGINGQDRLGLRLRGLHRQAKNQHGKSRKAT